VIGIAMPTATREAVATSAHSRRAREARTWCVGGGRRIGGGAGMVEIDTGLSSGQAPAGYDDI